MIHVYSMNKTAIVFTTCAFLYSQHSSSIMFGFFSNMKEIPLDSMITQSLTIDSDFVKTTEFDFIYKNLPKTGTPPRDFAIFAANPETRNIFQSHFKRIKLINCRNLERNQHSTSQKNLPRLYATELYSGPVALNLAQSGKKVVVLIFADSTNVGGIYMTKVGNPADTQEEQTVLMAPEIYGYLGNNFGVHDISKDCDEIYSARQKRYCTNKDDYKSPKNINPAYGFILTNLLITHDVKYSKMIKLPKDKVAEISYAFLSMPSFATDISRDPTGAMLINCSGEKNGETIYDRMRRVFNILLADEKVKLRIFNNEIMRAIGKIAIFYPIEKLHDFSKRYLEKDLDSSEILAEVIKIKLDHPEKVASIFSEAQQNYEKCVLRKFINLIRGAETAKADTLVLGKIGCGAFLNDENEIAVLIGRALSECRSIKHVYFAGLKKSDSFVEKVRVAMNKET